MTTWFQTPFLFHKKNLIGSLQKHLSVTVYTDMPLNRPEHSKDVQAPLMIKFIASAKTGFCFLRVENHYASQLLCQNKNLQQSERPISLPS